MNFIIVMLFFLIMIMISVTFLTLLEQKVLSYIQIRKGPNKSGFMGIFQPFCEAIKLFLKEFTLPIYSNYLIYYFSPVLSLLLSLFIWLSIPYFFNCISFNLLFLFIFSCLSLGVYFIMFSGWSSNSNYSLLGSMRAVAQTISYEVCMILFFLCYIFLLLSLNLLNFFYYQEYFSFLLLNFMMSLILFIIFLAETNRAPFDFAEGESELVSGFNIEYSSGGFALIFLSEYSMILFLSMIFSIMFLFNSYFYIFFYLKFMLVSYLFILIRGSYPRFRYDKLMNLTWKIYLPISLFMIIFFFCFKFIIIYY